MKNILKLMAVLLLMVFTFATFAACTTPNEETPPATQKLPVLIYHHFDETSTMYTVVSTMRFREQMSALHKAGYQSVSIKQVLDFVDNGTPLPKKSFMITMDDGYASNLTIAAPILQEFGFNATVFAIGIHEGESTNAYTGQPLSMDRFSFEDALPWMEKGVIDLQSHTFSMHLLEESGLSDRNGIMPKDNEDQDAYEAALIQDNVAFVSRWWEHGLTQIPVALAYPYGRYSEKSNNALKQMGYRVTFTTQEHCNLLTEGQVDCLWNLGRYNVVEGYSGENLANKLNDIYNEQ